MRRRPAAVRSLALAAGSPDSSPAPALPEDAATTDPDPVTADLEAALGHAFTDRDLLRRCLTHSSIARTPVESNERLEFLGDAILGAVVCERLFVRHRGLPEGDLTRLKSALVSRRYCAVLADRLGLENLLRTGKGLAGVRRADGRAARVPRSLLSNAFEAVVAGVYLDGGWPAAAACVNRVLDAAEAAGAGPTAASAPVTAPAPVVHGSASNHKSRLQHLAQSAGLGFPRYEVLSESGPDHAKRFTVRALLAGAAYPPGEGASKKLAEQAAAAAALAAGAGQPAGGAA